MNLSRIFKRENASKPVEAEATEVRGGSFGNNSVQVSSSAAALSVAAFQRAIVLRANTMSQLLMQYQRLDRDGGNYVVDNESRGGGMGSRINYMLQIRPNPTMSAPVFFRQAMMNVDLQGNAVIYVEREFDGEIKNFWLCSFASYNILDNKYQITYNGIGGMKTKSGVKAEEIIHLKGVLSSDNGLTGIALLKYGAKTLSLAATNDKLVLENASKGGKMKLLVQEDKQVGFGLGRANKKELEKVTKQLQDDIYSQDVVLLNNIASVTPISQNMQQQEIQSARQFSVKEIARITGVPPILLMDDSNSSYKSPEASTQEFLLRTIAPIIREWEAEFNAKLLGPENFGIRRFHLCEKPLLRLDPKATADVAKIQLECGIKTVNELRAEQDMSCIEGGDEALVSTNLQKASDIKVGQPTVKEGGTV